MAHEPAQITTPAMSNEILSIEEINARFDGEWVMLLDPMIGENQVVVGGKLACHSKDREEVYDTGVRLRPKSCAFLYIGKPDKDMVFLL